MKQMTREMFLSWSRHSSFKKKVSTTQNVIEDLFNLNKTCNVSVSGGKDSLVLLDLLLKRNPELLVWHWDYGIYMLRKYQKEIESILTHHFKIKNLYIDRRTSRARNCQIGYKAFFKAIEQHILKNNVKYNFIGLRREESCRRNMRCKKLLESAQINNYRYFNVFLIRDWTWRDIWAYILSQNIPYPSAYDIRGEFMGWNKVRFVTFFDEEFQHLGGPIQDKYFFWKEREIS